MHQAAWAGASPTVWLSNGTYKLDWQLELERGRAALGADVEDVGASAAPIAFSGFHG